MKINLTDDIDALDMGDKVSNALKRGGIYNVADLIIISKSKLLKMRGIGEKVILRIERAMTTNITSDNLSNLRNQIEQKELMSDESISFRNEVQVKKIKKEVSLLTNEIKNINIRIKSMEEEISQLKG